MSSPMSRLPVRSPLAKKNHLFVRTSSTRSSLRMSTNGSEAASIGSPSPGPYLNMELPGANLHSPCSILSRSSTSSRVNPNGQQTTPDRAFGSTIYVMKEDHERERQRWQSRVDEIEVRLAESEMLNSDMGQIKAELNKKIVELEKNQKPLIDQNRKLNDRNKMLHSDIKKVEQKLCHSQDDFLTLKDSHERLLKENTVLKEKRTFPEKLEELDRYRNQVLEYSKCITALRQSGIEKDRRYELLVQRFKRLKKCIRKGGDTEDDRQSTVGSTCSDESSVSLDTITEDLEDCVNKEIEINYQALYRENEDLQRALEQLKISSAFSDEMMLRDQLAFAHQTIAQQQILINNNNDRISLVDQLRATILAQKETIMELEADLEKVNSNLAVATEEKELMEFQMIEKEEIDKELMEKSLLSSEKSDVHCETEEIFDEGDEPSVSNKKKLDKDGSSTLKTKLAELYKALNLKLHQRQTIADTSGYVNALEEDINNASTMNNSQTVDWASREEEYVDRINKLQTEVDISKGSLRKQVELEQQLNEIKQTTVDMERAKHNMNEEVNRLSKEMGKLRFILKTKDETLEKEKQKQDDLQKKLTSLTSSRTTETEFMEQSSRRQSEQLQTTKNDLTAAEKKIDNLTKEKEKISGDLKKLSEEYAQFREDQRPSIRTELERRYEETKYKLNTALEKVHDYEVIIEAAKKRDECTSLGQALQEELLELKQYNEHLERQFKAQTDIIEALKARVIQNRCFADFLAKSTDNAASIEDRLAAYSNDSSADKETQKMIWNLSRIIQTLKKDQLLAAIQPLEISTAHSKVRAFNSADSAGCLSNSSEGITSPEGERASDDEWEKRERKLNAHRTGNDFVSDRSSSALSS